MAVPPIRIPRGRTFTVGDVTRDTFVDGIASVTLSNASGVSAQEFYLVQDVEGATALQRLQAAAEAPGIPKRGTLHALLRVPVESVRAEFVGQHFGSDAKVTVNYGLVQGAGGFDNDPDDVNALPQIEVIATLQPVTTEFDVFGNVLVIDNYQRFPRDANNDIVAGPPELLPPQAGTVEVTKDFHTIIARRRERVAPGVDKGPTYTNTINNGVVFSDVKHIWKCAISGTTDDGGDTWNVVYEFQRNWPDTWNKVIVWQDPETGLPGVDVTRPPTMEPGATGNGSKVTMHYYETNFRGLQLPIFD